MDKSTLIERFRAVLRERLATVDASIADAKAGMRVDGGFRPENRGERGAVTAQGYLAAGLARRSREIKEALELLDQVDPGPREQTSPGAWLLLVDDDDRERAYLLLPGGQGDHLDGPEGGVTVISPRAPIARALRGLREGDEARVRLDGRERTVEILELR